MASWPQSEGKAAAGNGTAMVAPPPFIASIDGVEGASPSVPFPSGDGGQPFNSGAPLS
jgi:hypothetical protein